MANIYVRSTDGSDADNGSTWALAKATLNGAAAIDAAGDSIYLSQAHAETGSAVQTIAFAGTLASPTKVICGNDAAEPPTAVSTAATITYTSTGAPTLNGNAYIRGVSIITDAGTINLNQTAPGVQFYESCAFKITGTSNRFVSIGTTVSGLLKTEWKNCSVSFNAAGQRVTAVGAFVWSGGSFIDGGTDPTALVSVGGSGGRSCDVLMEALNLSACATGVYIFDTATILGTQALGVIRNCKLPASWTGALISTALSAPGVRLEMYNCDSSDTNYRLWVEDYAGSIKSETTIVRTGGASDGATPLSWKMASVANAEYPMLTLSAPEIVRWNDTTGSAITATVEIITDNVTLTDAECWLEVQYLGTSGFPLGSFISDAKADVLATAANQTSSSVTWSSVPGTPVKQNLSVTFTPQEKGFIHAVVKLAKASTTVYVDPLLTIT